jgi:L-rhamnose isomerase
LLIEYKPFEPAFYHTDVADWGMAYLLAKDAGPQALVLVDTGHHYQAQNIEQIVAWLLHHHMLGGFHFNDRRYADDDSRLHRSLSVSESSMKSKRMNGERASGHRFYGGPEPQFERQIRR